jgi:hypothetical protein
MKRRKFFIAAGAAAAMPAFGYASQPGKGNYEGEGDYLELIRYRLSTGARKTAVRDFYRDAAIPALNKMGISPVGVFNVKFGANDPSLYVLIGHKSLESFVTLPQRILDNKDLMTVARDYMDAPMSDPAYVRMEKTLFKAFKNLPSINVPADKMGNPSRIYEMRTYESHNLKSAMKKIEMFNEGGEIDLFKKTGLFPVFFGETLAGSMMPNLTYMVVFNDMAERDKNWAVFGQDPGWQKISKEPQYANTVSNITDFILTPDACSQV